MALVCLLLGLLLLGLVYQPGPRFDRYHSGSFLAPIDDL
jgi:hypothetical protein